MKLIRTHQLSPAHLPAVTALIRTCTETDRTAFTYPAGEIRCHYLLFADSGQLAALYMILNPAEPEEAECIAFTRPDQRRKGYFRQLLEACTDDFPDMDIVFPVNHAVPSALKVMDALEADCISTNYQMELYLPDAAGHQSAGTTPFPASGTKPGPVLKEESESVLTLTGGTTVLGSCQLQYYESSACLHHVGIRPEYRRQGYAAGMLKLLFPLLEDKGIKRLFLHVSADNSAAVSLYEKTGFRITETLSYYLF